MLRKIRVTLACLFFALICLLFVDVSGALHAWLGWMAKIQLLPAALALNVAVVAALLLVTLLFGRVYCSVICPLGIFQDIVSHLRGMGSRRRRFRFRYRKALNAVRIAILAVFAVLLAVFAPAASVIEPYSAFGRMASSLFAPVYALGNNLLALIAERLDSYAFYSREVWIASIPVFLLAAATLVTIVLFAWFGGRTWCNTICPVGTILGGVSRFSAFAPVIDRSKCVDCGLCAKSCKASCIDPAAHKVDTSRCVDCMDCIGSCSKGAISYSFRWGKKSFRQNGPASAAEEPSRNTASPAASDPAAPKASPEGASRRAFISTAVLATAGFAAAKAQDKVDGGFAPIVRKTPRKREVAPVPAGSMSIRHLSDHCIACGLCISACPSHVLRPSDEAASFMQPRMSFDKGWCRPGCNVCSTVCPAGAIIPVTVEEKTSIQTGRAKVDLDMCVAFQGKDSCGNCSRRCPSGAIRMVKSKDTKFLIPAVNEEKCIGCGACEHLCPVSPLSAIHVEGNEVHITL